MIPATIRTMTSPLASPDAVAEIVIPGGVQAVRIETREQWLAVRQRDVTASVAAALFGEHPYCTPYRLWALHRGIVTEDRADNKLFKRGRLLEPVILELLREEFPTWTIAPCRTYYREAASRLGATPDFIATRPDMPGFGVIEGKSVGKFAFKKGWRGMDGDMSIPLWIGVQVSQTAMLTGASWAMIAPMEIGDGGLELHTEEVEIRPALMTRLRQLAKEFFRRVEENDPPPQDFDRDAYVINQIYALADEGETADLSGNDRIVDLLAKREGYKATEKNGADAEKARKTLDAEIIGMLGNAARGRLSDGRVVEALTVRRRGYEVAPSSYRTVKVK